MSLFDRTKSRAEFLDEITKQTEPYTYFIAEEKEELRGVREKSSPLYSIVEFNTNEDSYLVFMNARGKANSDAILSLLLDADLVYCDEDYISSDGKRHTPWFKPDWSPDTLLSFNYIGGLFVVRKSVAEQVDMLTEEQEPDEAVRIYDFLLKYTEMANKIVHVPEILLHNTDCCLNVMTDEDRNSNAGPDSIKAGAEEKSRQIYEAVVTEYESEKYTAVRNAAFVRRGFKQLDKELISIIIPSKDHADILIRCIESIKDKTTAALRSPSSLEIIIVDNGSCVEEKGKISSYIENNPDISMIYLYEPAPFNYSKMCNTGAKQAKGSYLLFLNDDMEMRDKVFIEKLFYYASAPHVGAAGAKLYYPDSDIIQHAGVTNLICGPSHKLATHSDSEIYYFGRNRFNMDVLAVTGACMMLSKEKYFNVGGFSDRMEVSYNDIDLCVNLYEQGYFNVILNDCILYHHESLSRGTDMADDKKYARLYEERKLFYERHSWLLNQSDPFYNRHLLQDTLDFRPDVQAEYEERDYRNEMESLVKLPGNFIKRQEKLQKKLNYHIEQTGFERALDSTAKDAYRIEGWGILLEADNALYERYLTVIPVLNGELSITDGMQFRVSPKYREDVKQVFPKAKDAEVAGFVCRISQSYLTDDQTYQIGMLFVSKLWKHKKYIMLGDYYAAERRERKLCKRD